MTRRPAIAAAVLLLAATAALPSRAADPVAPDTPAAAGSTTRVPAVSVVAATRRDVVETVIVTGTLVPREEVQVSADVDGLKIEEILVEAGDRVAAGAVLARLSTDMLDVQLAQNASQTARTVATIAQAEASIAEAEANAVQASASLERNRSLARTGVISQDALEQRIQAADAAKARLRVAQQTLTAAIADKALNEAQRREIELRREKTEIKTPTAGLVLARSARLGAIVSGQSGALFRVAEDGMIELDAEVPETLLARIDEGQPVAVLSAGSTEPAQGTVRLVSPEVDAATRLGKVRVALPKDADVRTGTFARGTVEVARRSGLALPVSAVTTVAGASTVQVVVDGKVVVREVEIGLSGGGSVEIVSGLAEGDVVVARAGTFLRDGDPVKPVAMAGEGAKG